MRILEILCHPRPGSFNHTLAASARDRLRALGHEVFFHDLHEEGFDPVLDSSELSRLYSLDGLVQEHSRELSQADGLVIFHPDWWSQPPAMLKGWVDRVFRQGVAYELDGEDGSEKKWKGLLAGKKGFVFCTSDAEEGETVGALESLWKNAILGRCGMEAECFVVRDMRGPQQARRRDWIRFVTDRLGRAFPGPRAQSMSSAALRDPSAISPV
ncbi:MAG TPA: NAD(P)H-dependent oxidoreductase [Spirochaetia bacterium]|nr:NAD(P)H-dependent oxidoreductase [Spirochaetia bacterium]